MSVLSQPGVHARRALLCLSLALLVAPLAARSEDAAGVTIDNFTFSLPLLTINAGTEVKWTNHDDIPHTIVLPALNVRSKTIDTDGTFTYRFKKPGTYTYICGLHPHMTAKIVVK